MFTIDKAKKMLQGVLRDAPDKFYSSIYTIVRDGIEDVTPSELSATVAAIATEVRVESLAGTVKTLEGRLNALARRYLKLEGEVKAAPLPAPAEEGTAVGGETSGNGSYIGPPADEEEAEARRLFAAADAAKGQAIVVVTASAVKDTAAPATAARSATPKKAPAKAETAAPVPPDAAGPAAKA